MIPVLYSIGPIRIHSYGLLVALGVLTAVFIVRKNALKVALNPDLMVDIALGVVLAGFIGARLFYVGLYWSYFKDQPLEILMLWKGGIVLYGGLMGGLFAFYIYSKLHQISFLKLLDLFLPAALLAQGFGRIGCFLNGCCYGAETKLPWAVSFPFSDHYVHPTQLYSSFYCFGIALFLLHLFSKQPATGVVAGYYFLLYGSGRFVLEFFRGDNPAAVFCLTVPQLMSIAVVLVGLIILRTRRTNAKRELYGSV
jgi:phosphatidylglycerol---prolipoprotein diacylglyceryl transferase